MFPIHSHLKMLNDRIRMDAYQKAIFNSVRKGDVVVDIGTGTGILAFFACQAGAGRVYAIEQSEIIETAKKTAKENGFSDRIVFINKKSEEVELPEKADMIITETIGCLGIDENIVCVLNDAKKRFLKRDGIMIPSNLSLLAVPVHIEQDHPFSFLEKTFYGLKAGNLEKLAENSVYGIAAAYLGNLHWLSHPQKMLSIDFNDHKPLNFPIVMESSFEIDSKVDYHGVCVFPEITLLKNVKIVLFDDQKFISTHWEIPFFPAAKKISLENFSTLDFYLTVLEKNGFTWRHIIKQGSEKKEFTQLSIFGLPSLKDFIPAKEFL